ncbi:MAG: hypothetical protein WBV73_30395 [Phormidium sp.]
MVRFIQFIIVWMMCGSWGEKVGMAGWDESVITQIVASKRSRKSRKVWLKPWGFASS